MPYDIHKRGGRFCVIKSGDGENMGCHDTRAEAEAQMRALYAAEDEEQMHSRRYFSSVDLRDWRAFLAPAPAMIAPGEELEEEEEAHGMRLRIPLLPEGTFQHEFYGQLAWTPAVFADMIRNFGESATGFQPCLNYDHSSHNPFAADKRAAGWFTALEHEAGTGLFGMVDLTPAGQRCIEEGEYRYISAEVADAWTTSDGRSFANVIVGAALTNMPFHDTMKGLFSRDGEQAMCFAQSGPGRFWVAGDKAGAGPAGGDTEMNLLDKLRRVFGLPETATEDEAVAAVEAVVKPAEEPAATETEDEAAAVVQAAAPAAGTVTLSEAEVVTLRADAAAAQQARAQAEELRQQLARNAASASVDALVTAGKLAPAQREAALALALADPTGFAALYEHAPQVIDLKPRGFIPRRDDGETAQTFQGLVGQAMAQDSALDYVEAARRVAEAHPELYEQHRATMRTPRQ